MRKTTSKTFKYLMLQYRRLVREPVQTLMDLRLHKAKEYNDSRWSKLEQADTYSNVEKDVQLYGMIHGHSHAIGEYWRLVAKLLKRIVKKCIALHYEYKGLVA